MWCVWSKGGSEGRINAERSEKSRWVEGSRRCVDRKCCKLCVGCALPHFHFPIFDFGTRGKKRMMTKGRRQRGEAHSSLPALARVFLWPSTIHRSLEREGSCPRRRAGPWPRKRQQVHTHLAVGLAEETRMKEAQTSLALALTLLSSVTFGNRDLSTRIKDKSRPFSIFCLVLKSGKERRPCPMAQWPNAH